MVKDVDPEPDADIVGEIPLKKYQLKVLKETRRIVREENAEMEKRILAEVDKRVEDRLRPIREDLAPVREVAEVEKKHSDFKKKRADNAFDKEMD
jgi:hypothetical protein